MKRSEKVTKNLRSSFYFAVKSVRPLFCHAIEEAAGKGYTDEQRVKMREAEKLFGMAKDIVKQVYGEIIGKLVVEENT